MTLPKRVYWRGCWTSTMNAWRASAFCLGRSLFCDINSRTGCADGRSAIGALRRRPGLDVLWTMWRRSRDQPKLDCVWPYMLQHSCGYYHADQDLSSAGRHGLWGAGLMVTAGQLSRLDAKLDTVAAAIDTSVHRTRGVPRRDARVCPPAAPGAAARPRRPAGAVRARERGTPRGA